MSIYDIPNSPPPAVYDATIEAVAPGISSLVANQQTAGESWTDTLLKVLPGLAATYQQRQILAAQVERAKQGLPPLDMSQYGLQVSVGMSQDTKILIGAGVAVLAVVLLMQKRRR
jgi:hypothetical protein